MVIFFSKKRVDSNGSYKRAWHLGGMVFLYKFHCEGGARFFNVWVDAFGFYMWLFLIGSGAHEGCTGELLFRVYVRS